MADLLNGLVWVAAMPESLRCIDQCHRPEVLSHMIDEVAVVGVVESNGLVQMRLRGGEIAEPEKG